MEKIKRYYVKKKRFIPLLFMSLPGFAYLIFNNYIPMVGILLAFRKVDFSQGIFGGKWVGLQNFQFLFASNQTALVVRNTLLYNAVFILLGNVVAVFLAVLMNAVRNNKFVIGFGQTSVLLPNMVSYVLISYMALGFLSFDLGVINTRILPAFGMEPINWYYAPEPWPVILTIFHLWKSCGFQSLIYYSTIRGIDPGLYEAAQIDGANRWQQFRSITLPGLRQIMIIMMILAVGRIFASDFGLFYQLPMNSSALYNVTSTIDTYVYRCLTTIPDLGMSSVTGFMQSVLGFILVMSVNFILRRVSPEDAFF